MWHKTKTQKEYIENKQNLQKLTVKSTAGNCVGQNQKNYMTKLKTIDNSAHQYDIQRLKENGTPEGQ